MKKNQEFYLIFYKKRITTKTREFCGTLGGKITKKNREFDGIFYGISPRKTYHSKYAELRIEK